MPNLTLHDILFLVLIEIACISIPLAIIYFIDLINRKRALKAADKLPYKTLSLLSDKNNYSEVTVDDRISYAKEVLVMHIGIFLLIIVGLLIYAFKETGSIYLNKKSIFYVAQTGGLFFISMIKELLTVAPWVKVYRIKAVKCFSAYPGYGKSDKDYVCYYDFIKEEFATASPGSIGMFITDRKDRGTVLDAFAFAKRNKLKVIGYIENR